MGDKTKEAQNDRGQRDGAKYAKSDWISQTALNNYHPPSEPKEKAAYDKGHGNGRTGGK